MGWTYEIVSSNTIELLDFSDLGSIFATKRTTQLQKKKLHHAEKTDRAITASTKDNCTNLNNS